MRQCVCRSKYQCKILIN
ncbi:DUF3709 domain-containing protein [Laceyella sacchari]